MNLLNKYSQLASKLLIALSLTIASAAYAGPGHDHGEEKPTTDTNSSHYLAFMLNLISMRR